MRAPPHSLQWLAAAQGALWPRIRGASIAIPTAARATGAPTAAPAALSAGAAQGGTTPELLQGTALGVLLQLALAAPFLLRDPGAYLRRAFELTRVFQHTWSVNLKFLPPHVFLDPWLAAGLLAAHVTTLWLFARRGPLPCHRPCTFAR